MYEDLVNEEDYHWTTQRRLFKIKHLLRKRDLKVCDTCFNHRCYDSNLSFKRWGGKSWKLYRKTQYKVI